ncbi:MAG: VOC family protein [Candidatus Eisenbacteria bacterium]
MSSRFETYGDFSWCELLTRDVDGSKKFYADVLGWEMEAMPMEGGSYTVVKAGGEAVGGIMTMPPQVPAQVPSHWGAYVTVEDVDAVAKKAKDLGATILVPPMDIPNVGRFCTFQDPQGAALSIIAYIKRSK